MASALGDRMQLQSVSIGKLAGALALAGLLAFFVRLYQARTWFRNEMKKHRIPMLPHSFLFGHLIVIAKVVTKMPTDFSLLGVSYLLAKEYPEVGDCGLVYMDVWPLGHCYLQVYHPDMMAQFLQEKSLPKHKMMHRELYPLTKCHDLVTLEGQQWKTWRSIFNPGFSAKNLAALLPAFLEEIQVLKERLVAVAENKEVVALEHIFSKAMVDIILRAVLGIRHHYQTKESPFMEALKEQIGWLLIDYSIPTLLKSLYVFRPFILWKNNRKMKRFLAPHIESGIAEYAESSGQVSGVKTINFLAIKAYMSEVQTTKDSNTQTRVDPHFVEMAISQLKIFIFAGHDTTASTLSFVYSHLFSDPSVLAKTRAEHDAVLGTDPSAALKLLTANPQLLNQLPYTSAVIKEALRFYPPAGTVRTGSPDCVLVHPDTGKQYPTDGFAVVSSSFATHRLEAYWERPDEFLPERWLAREGEPLHVRKNAWRPFEIGPRNCIGQELAQMEMRAILAMTLRELDFESAYPASSPEVLGRKAYQVMAPGDITGHVKGGFPVRIKIRKS